MGRRELARRESTYFFLSEQGTELVVINLGVVWSCGSKPDRL